MEKSLYVRRNRHFRRGHKNKRTEVCKDTGQPGTDGGSMLMAEGEDEFG